MTHRIACTLALMVASLAGAPAQEPAPAPDAEQERAEELLRAVDGRIYYPSEHGLEDFRFRYQVRVTDDRLAPVDGMFLVYSWKKPDLSRVDYLDANGKPALRPSGSDAIKAFCAELETSVHTIAQQFMVGVPLARIYRDYYKTVTEREVNNKAEYRIVMTPRSKKNFSKITIKIVGGLPREIVKTAASGLEFVGRFRYTKRGDEHLPKGVKWEVANDLKSDEEYFYVLKKDIYMMSHMERVFPRGPVKRTIDRIDALEVNIGLPDSYFPPRRKVRQH